MSGLSIARRFVRRHVNRAKRPNAAPFTQRDGPFTESKEVIAGFSIIQVRSKAEAIEWASLAPFTGASVEDYIASRANEQRMDCRELMVLFKKITRQSPKMWGPSIVGYGSYWYTYESGHTGEAPLAGFAIRGRDLVVYLVAHTEEQSTAIQAWQAQDGRVLSVL